jgi:MYXO-CTERM domain-containing protein
MQKKSGRPTRCRLACTLLIAAASCRSGDAFQGAPEVATRALACGEERWAVKVGTDEDAALVDPTVLDATVAQLVSFPAPPVLPSTRRVVPYERRVYRLAGVVLDRYKLETDSDYHMVISEGAQTMIVEIPAPGCVDAASSFASGIRRARASFDARLTATDFFQTANTTVSLVGVGFFDLIHGQSGVAPNGFELHPVTAICFGAGCALDVPGVDGGNPDGGRTTSVGTSGPGPGGCGCASSAGADVLGWPALVGVALWHRARRQYRAVSTPRRRLAAALDQLGDNGYGDLGGSEGIDRHAHRTAQKREVFL